jgi:transposase
MRNQLFHANLFPDLSKVTLRRVFKTDQGWVMEADGQDSAVCPGCQSISRSRHSRYWRSLKDLPVQGTPVILRLHVGRWRCRNAGCERQIFTQHLSEVCAPHARQTKRSGEIIAMVGRALGGRPGQRLMSRLGMPLSADTLIRRVKKAARRSALPHPIRVLGVDDWAWSKGQTFGTILVDLERSQVVDLLPTRSADSLVEWLAQYPEVTIVSRDRQGVYSEGARRGAPEAVQVADRFHLVLNLIQAVERHLAVNRRHLRIARPSAPALPPSPTTEEVKSQSKPIQVRSSVMMQQMEVARQRRQQKLELFRTIKQMRAAGMKVSLIARQLGLCRRRIDKWIQLDELPERSRMQPRPGMPESFRDYLRQRWEAGCRQSLVRFVRTLKQDLSAVEAAVSKPWSNGPVEGQLNRVKMLKRQMYGRAGIELLRARLLPEPAFSDP